MAFCSKCENASDIEKTLYGHFSFKKKAPKVATKAVKGVGIKKRKNIYLPFSVISRRGKIIR
jgi:hypothetical protein